MGNKQDERRAALRERLIAAAEVELTEKGLGGLKARDVTARAGCALGALYNAVEDLDMLVLHVNARTLTRLGAALRATLPDEAEDPETAMQALASAYITFATENRRLWQTLFEHRLPEGRGIPDWHKRDHAVLIEVIVPPLSRLRPDLGAEALALRARTIFAAVHGVVHLALQGRFVGVPAEALREEVAALVETLARGSAAARP